MALTMKNNVNSKLICFRIKNIIRKLLSNYIMISILLIITLISVVSLYYLVFMYNLYHSFKLLIYFLYRSIFLVGYISFINQYIIILNFERNDEFIYLAIMFEFFLYIYSYTWYVIEKMFWFSILRAISDRKYNLKKSKLKI